MPFRGAFPALPFSRPRAGTEEGDKVVCSPLHLGTRWRDCLIDWGVSRSLFAPGFSWAAVGGVMCGIVRAWGFLL